MSRRKAAIIDDDPSVRRGLTRLFRALDWEPSAYGSAEEFLSSGHERDMALVLVDIHLPGMSGVELLQKLQRMGIDHGVLLMTAHGESETRDLLHPVRDAVCLRKPFGKEELLSAIV